MRKRLLCLVLLFALALSALVIRLAAIQLMEGSKYRVLAENQRHGNLSSIYIRGTIYDRSNRPLTDIGDSFFFLIEERKIDGVAEGLLDRMDARDIESSSDKYRIYRVSSIDRTGVKRLCRDYGALAVAARQRYSENQPAMHMIGYVDMQDQSGVCGIEKDFDDVLSSGRKLLSVQNDGQGYMIPGAGIRIEGGGKDWGVLTTLDLDLQNTAQQALLESGQSGAVIIAHIPSGEILASASAPGYDPYHMGEYMDSGGEGLQNKATSGMYPAGPLFSVIAAAATLEKGAGDLKSILEMARDLGFSEEAVDLLSGQSEGNLSELEERLHTGDVRSFDGPADLLITPMQAARMACIIGGGGWDFVSGLSVIRGTVEGIRGAWLFPRPEGRHAVSNSTARMLGEMLKEMEGKSVVDTERREKQAASGWLIGCVPTEDPQYAITVYLEDESPGKGTTASVFEKIEGSFY